MKSWFKGIFEYKTNENWWDNEFWSYPHESQIVTPKNCLPYSLKIQKWWKIKEKGGLYTTAVTYATMWLLKRLLLKRYKVLYKLPL